MDPAAPPNPGDRANRILRAIPNDDRHALVDLGTMRYYERDHVLQEAGDPIEAVHFPLSGVLSMLAVLSDGNSVEAATIGREGLAGLPVYLGARFATTRTVVQVPGWSLRVDSDAFRDVLPRCKSLTILLARYTELLFISAAQSAACNRLHSVLERCARLLLTWNDRLADGAVPVTQEALAEALGVRRASVTQAVSALAGAGAIRRGRGRLLIKDRDRLEAEACECYAVIDEAFARNPG